jgi:hypothetical protein
LGHDLARSAAALKFNQHERIVPQGLV